MGLFFHFYSLSLKITTNFHNAAIFLSKYNKTEYEHKTASVVKQRHDLDFHHSRAIYKQELIKNTEIFVQFYEILLRIAK